MDEERYQYDTILLITESLFKEQHKILITAFWDLKEVNIAPEFPFYHQNCEVFLLACSFQKEFG